MLLKGSSLFLTHVIAIDLPSGLARGGAADVAMQDLTLYILFVEMIRIVKKCNPNFLVGAILMVFMLEGCVGFSSGQLPKYGYQDILVSDHKPSIDYAIKLSMNDKEEANLHRYQEIVEKVFSKTAVFSKYSPGIGTEQYHISIEVKVSYPENSIMAVSALTLFIFPGYLKENYLMNVDVRKNDQLLKHYEYKEDIHIWSQVFLIFLMRSHNVLTETDKLLENMLLNFVHDLEKDNILEPV